MALTTLKKWLFILLIPLILLIILSGSVYYLLISEKDPVVKTRIGTIQGLKATDGDYDMYLGVPYAHVNKTNAFGLSIPHRKFKKAFRAHDDSAVCPQYEEFNKTIIGSLDCLRLNIYVPHATSIENPVPVLVFIHGGDYKSGFGGRSLYGPRYLMKHDIIFVTVNYRIGPYGFLCTDLAKVSGNQGLKDQVLALQWIKNNIECFGGKADQITLAGVGSGGENVNLHLLYGKEPLFQKAIIESGIYLDQLDEEDGIESVPIALANNFGFNTTKNIAAVNFLIGKSPKSVIASSMKLHLEYGPCIEKNISGHTFITNETLRSDSEFIKTVPILISQSNKELLKVFAHRNLNDYNASSIFRDDLIEHFKVRDEQLRKLEINLRRFYIGDEKISESVKKQIVDFKSDLYHNFPTRRMIDKYLKMGAKSIYYGVFSYSGGRNFVKKLYNITGDGATREDVLGYLFDTPYIAGPVSKDDQFIIDRMTALWANFVKHGDPTPMTTKMLPVKWKPVTADKLNYMEISSKLTPKVTPFYNRTAFWDLFLKLYGKLEIPTKLIEPWLN